MNDNGRAENTLSSFCKKNTLGGRQMEGRTQCLEQENTEMQRDHCIQNFWDTVGADYEERLDGGGLQGKPRPVNN